MFSFGIKRFILRLVLIVLLALVAICLFGCARFALVDRSSTTASTYSGANQTISEAPPIIKSWEMILKENALTLSLGTLTLLLLYAYLKQRGAFKGIVHGVDRFKEEMTEKNPKVLGALHNALRADTTPRQRKLVRKFRV